MAEATERLSTHDDWEKHWKNFRAGNIEFIRFDDLVNDLPHQGTFIEVGGFPGLYSVYFYKKLGLQPTLIDFVVKKEIINSVEKGNGVPENTIEVIPGDFFNYQSEKKYDVVFSWGFIEHFKDIDLVIRKHTDLLKPGGSLLIGLPNLRGIPGWYTRIVDPEAIRIHNLECMDSEFLNKTCEALPLTDVKVFYWGKPKVWLNASSRFDNRAGRFITWLINLFLNRIPLRNKTFSPHIIIKARKSI